MHQQKWERELREASTAAQQALQRTIDEVNDDLVPRARQQGVAALQALARMLRRLADALEPQPLAMPHAGQYAPRKPAQRTASEPVFRSASQAASQTASQTAQGQAWMTSR